MYIFKTIVNSASYPASWIKSVVLPVPKINSPSSVSDFRPISLLPVLSKIFEVLIKTQILDHLSTKKVLSDSQSGFRKNYSTTSAILKICEDIKDSLAANKATVLVLLDLSKAFDSIDHATLCLKLKRNFNFSSSTCNLLYSYLAERSISVIANGVSSIYKNTFSGVPQGSILGPILFSIYINDLPSILRYSSSHLYADDTQLYRSSSLKELPEAITLINKDLQSVLRWTNENYLSLNALKTTAIIIYKKKIVTSTLPDIMVNNVKVPFVDKIKNLGIMINSTLSWDDHVGLICSRVYGTLRSLYSIKNYLPIFLKRKLIISLVLPHLLYGDVIFFCVV